MDIKIKKNYKTKKLSALSDKSLRLCGKNSKKIHIIATF